MEVKSKAMDEAEQRRTAEQRLAYAVLGKSADDSKQSKLTLYKVCPNESCKLENPPFSTECQLCNKDISTIQISSRILPLKEGGAVNYKTKYLKYKSKNINF